ncbi:MAG: IS66 family insertion sequence element accessory protein TnpA [Clostridium sp.]
MPKENSKIDWDQIMNKFSSYNGSINEFCKDNNVKQHQLYHRRKKLASKTTPAFHAIVLNKDADEVTDKSNSSKVTVVKDIRIEIGKANIYIPANEIAALSDIIKELAKSC